MPKSQSRAEDERRNEGTQDRVTKLHGGEVIEAVAIEELESFNDADCKHEKLVRDETEKEFNAFVCSNPNCSEVILFDRTK